MSSVETTIRVIAASLALMCSTGFGVVYSEGWSHTIDHSSSRELLSSNQYAVTALAPIMTVVPIVALIAGVLLRKRPIGATLVISTSWVIALGWPLLVILAWEGHKWCI